MDKIEKATRRAMAEWREMLEDPEGDGTPESEDEAARIRGEVRDQFVYKGVGVLIVFIPFYGAYDVHLFRGAGEYSLDGFPSEEYAEISARRVIDGGIAREIRDYWLIEYWKDVEDEAAYDDEGRPVDSNRAL